MQIRAQCQFSATPGGDGAVTRARIDPYHFIVGPDGNFHTDQGNRGTWKLGLYARSQSRQDVPSNTGLDVEADPAGPVASY